MKETNIIGINLLQVGSESKLLEVLGQANLSDRELDELPFGRIQHLVDSSTRILLKLLIISFILDAMK